MPKVQPLATGRQNPQEAVLKVPQFKFLKQIFKNKIRIVVNRSHTTTSDMVPLATVLCAAFATVEATSGMIYYKCHS